MPNNAAALWRVGWCRNSHVKHRISIEIARKKRPQKQRGGQRAGKGALGHPLLVRPATIQEVGRRHCRLHTVERAAQAATPEPGCVPYLADLRC